MVSEQSVDRGTFEWALGIITGGLIALAGWVYAALNGKANSVEIKSLKDEIVQQLEDHMLDDKEQFARAEERDQHTQELIEDARKERREDIRHLYERLTSVETGLRSEMNQGFASLRDVILKKS